MDNEIYFNGIKLHLDNSSLSQNAKIYRQHRMIVTKYMKGHHCPEGGPYVVEHVHSFNMQHKREIIKSEDAVCIKFFNYQRGYVHKDDVKYIKEINLGYYNKKYNRDGSLDCYESKYLTHLSEVTGISPDGKIKYIKKLEKTELHEVMEKQGFTDIQIKAYINQLQNYVKNASMGVFDYE